MIDFAIIIIITSQWLVLYARSLENLSFQLNYWQNHLHCMMPMPMPTFTLFVHFIFLGWPANSDSVKWRPAYSSVREGLHWLDPSQNFTGRRQHMSEKCPIQFNLIHLGKATLFFITFDSFQPKLLLVVPCPGSDQQPVDLLIGELENSLSSRQTEILPSIETCLLQWLGS